ncbi:hypothetical protein Pmani_011441 [Petrolisthes manimaculis]|uniref:Uncharacterized protein n=1 Tax=Petrolisthes manimaculis TaxID=1843537 RepID=A0AAE1UB42_9EUCA|nr:hypothetical protein Pmani_011441 [Petrolisthes manimaculis]
MGVNGHMENWTSAGGSPLRVARGSLQIGQKNQAAPMKNLKKVDCALLPPCSKTVRNKLQRAHFVSIVWGNTESAHPDGELDPCDYGWQMKGGNYVPVWFSGPSVPCDLFEDEETTDVADQEVQNGTEDDVAEYEESNSESEVEWNDDSGSEDEL